MATNELSKAVGGNIRALLDERGITQETLSELSGIPMRTLSRRLHKLNPSAIPLEDLAAIADALEVPFVSLFPRRKSDRNDGGMRAAA